MTWELEFSASLEQGPAAARLERFIEGFARSVTLEESVSAGLPFYVDHLPYFQRMLATGLAASLQHSISETGEAALQRVLPALLPGGRA